MPLGGSTPPPTTKIMSKLYKNREHQREIKRKESIILYEDEKVKVIVPLTHQVSRIYGSGTKWCSSIGHYGEFERYSSSGVSYYILYKGISQGTSYYKVAAFKPFENKLPFIIFSPSVDSYIDKLSNKELLKDRYEDGGDFIRGSEEFSKYYLDLGIPDRVHYIKKLTTDIEFFLSDDASSIVEWKLEPRIYEKMTDYYVKNDI